MTASSPSAATGGCTSPPARSRMKIDAETRRMKRIQMAMRMLRRNASAGELRVLLVALFIAVASVTTVGFFADRVQSALDRQANDLLGGDLVLVSDHPVPAAFVEGARAENLTTVETRT